ncbi:MAG TPA: metallophosphoesterase, partial [Candidatus Parabacteroides intestinavium]|nr:metallophosphoesterase [Candidatus Parabacteroides intestinavium]
QPYQLGDAVQAGVDLQFSGHTHHGQVWPLNWLTDYLFEVSHGYKQIGSTHVYVSSGLSLWGPPFRIGTQSELIIFELDFK